jgi:glutamate N-acetyltransferase/amino-acid N-acetyltransferase
VSLPPWRNCPGGICAARGFLAAAERAGLKKAGLDLTIIVSDRPASAAACFTRNRCAAAPVTVSREHLKKNKGRARAILANSGCANAATGERGLQDTRSTVDALARSLDLPPSSILVCSTGVIGLPLQADRIIAKLPVCVSRLSRKQARRAAQAIATTDSVLKIESIAFQAASGAVRVGGIAKGAGMIHPDMATMLAFITTDAAISPAMLQRCLTWCVERSFNCITVDGDTSTNDTVILLANGASGVEVMEEPASGRIDSRTRRHGDTGAIVASPRPRVPASRLSLSPRPLIPASKPAVSSHLQDQVCEDDFRAALLEVCQRLARKIAWDGEGATHQLEIRVTGARSFEQARNVGRSIGRSNLVKTAIYGHDPNWGRVLSAAGASGERIDSSRVQLAIDGQVVAEGGVLKYLPDSVFTSVWKKKKIEIAIDLGLRDANATCWSCDLSHQYVDINASYRT